MITCTCCNQTLDTGELPPFETGVRVVRYVDCARGTVTHVSALKGDSAWTAVACRPKQGIEWHQLPGAPEFYVRLGKMLEAVDDKARPQ